MHRGRLPQEFRDRTKRFGAMAIRLFVKLPKRRDEVAICGKQMVRAGTSTAAGVREASRARSDAEFNAKLGLALQECDECQLWLEYLREECAVDPALTTPAETEAGELIAIMTTMIRRTGE